MVASTWSLTMICADGSNNKPTKNEKGYLSFLQIEYLMTRAQLCYKSQRNIADKTLLFHSQGLVTVTEVMLYRVIVYVIMGLGETLQAR